MPVPLLNNPLSPEMGKAVIEYLSAYGPLPKSGYLAGQAVASALFALYGVDGSVQGPVNDLDVFYTGNHSTEDLNSNFVHGADKEMFQISVNNYSQVELLDKSGRAIEVVYKQGNLNFIKMGGRTTEMLDVIKTFDFNVVSVGVDLSTGKLQWAPSFEVFVQDGKAKVEAARSFRSFARALKKRAEMPWIDWDIPAIAAHTFEADLTIARYGVKPIVHPTVQAMLDKYDPEGHYPRPDAYDYSEDLKGVYPTILSQPGTVNPLGLPSLQKTIAFADACKFGRTSEVVGMINEGFPASLPLQESSDMLCRGIEIARRKGHVEVFNHLSRHGKPSPAMKEVEHMLVRMDAKKANNVYSSNGPLHNAAAEGDVEFLRGVDLSVENIDAPALDGRTPLAIAAMFGSAEACSVLIDRGASLNGLPFKGGKKEQLRHTPLLDAVERGSLECVKALIERGADPHQVIEGDRGSYHVLVGRQFKDLSAKKARQTRIVDIVRLLKDAKVDINRADGKGNTPLYEASKRSAFGLIWPLIAHGADQRPGPDGSPLDIAIERENKAICARIIAAGIVPSERQKSVAVDAVRHILDFSQVQALVYGMDDEELMEMLKISKAGKGDQANHEAFPLAKHLEETGFDFESEVASQADKIFELLEKADFMQNKERLLRSWVTRREALAAISEVSMTSSAPALG